MIPPTIEMAGCSAELQPVRPSVALALHRRPDQVGRVDLVTFLGCAALRSCWPEDRKWPEQPPPPPWDIGEEALVDYGAKVFNGLVNAKVPLLEVQQHGLTAYRWAMDGLLGYAQVQAAQDFSPAPAEATAGQ